MLEAKGRAMRSTRRSTAPGEDETSVLRREGHLTAPWLGYRCEINQETSVTKTTTNPNHILEHGIWHGLISVWPWLLVIGIAVLGLMIYVEWKKSTP